LYQASALAPTRIHELEQHATLIIRSVSVQVNEMYETLQLNGHKIDAKDDVRRDDMQEAAAMFIRNLTLGKVCM
jgi:hypothetical protein